jgi:hypothetical protein
MLDSSTSRALGCKPTGHQSGKDAASCSGSVADVGSIDRFVRPATDIIDHGNK